MPDTRLVQLIRAPRAAVYQALVTADAVRQWMVPDDMRSEIHEFEGREGGRFRISLTYDAPTAAGKTSAQTDTYHGTFVRLVPDTEVVQTVEFETTAPGMQGEMTITMRLVDVAEGTELTATHANLPPALSSEDNDTGWRMSLEKLARLVERG